jgi:predicted Zn-dependent peptidase
MAALTFHQAKLANGLTVVGEEREGAVSTAVGFFVKTGSRDETDDVAGVSHFLEHMMFKGTAKRTALQITYDLAAIGAQANAFTSVENTVYYAVVLPEYTKDVFDILGDMMRPALLQEDFDTEKKVILEEIALYQDRPSHILFEEAMRQFYLNNKAGASVLGTSQSITDLTSQQMRAYFDRRYSPSNIVLTVTGSFDWQNILELAQKNCGHWIGPKVERIYENHIPAHRIAKKTKEGINTTHLSLIAPGPSLQSDDRYSMQLMCSMMGDSSGSRIFWSLIDKGLCDNSYLDAEEMDQTGLIYAYASCSPDKLDQVRDILRDILLTPMNFSEEDLVRAKTKVRTRLVLQGESTMRRLTGVGMEWLYEGTYTTLEEELIRYSAVTKDSIANAVSRYPLAPLTEVVLSPA